MKNLFLSFIAIFCLVSVSAQDQIVIPDSVPVEKRYNNPVCVVDELARPDSVTMATVFVFQDSSISKVIEKPVTYTLQEAKGYRIQIFSSNRGAAARERSFEIKEVLLSKHPKLENDIYITYNSPFWKVRIGNCQSHEKAQELCKWIIDEYPEFANETYIVPSVILIP